jgi:recombination associated protein RdgC
MLWFKNAQVFQFIAPFSLSANEFETKLQQFRLRRCGKTESFTQGWQSPSNNQEAPLLLASQHCMLFSFAREERILPASVIQEHLQQKIKQIEQAEDRKVYSKEKRRLRDEIIFELLPKSFTKQKRCLAYIDPQAQWLIIDSSNKSEAENLIELLRKSLGALKVEAISVNNTPTTQMTHWLQQKTQLGRFTIDDHCELFDSKRNSTIKCNGQDPLAAEISAHIDTGKEVTQLSLTWDDRISFILNKNLQLKRLKPLDLLNQQWEEGKEEEDDEQLSLLADISLVQTSLLTLLTDLFALFDGITNETTNPVKISAMS